MNEQHVSAMSINRPGAYRAFPCPDVFHTKLRDMEPDCPHCRTHCRKGISPTNGPEGVVHEADGRIVPLVEEES
jgi:hypothetical protein